MKIAEEIELLRMKRKERIINGPQSSESPETPRVNRASLDELAKGEKFKKIALYWRIEPSKSGKNSKELDEKTRLESVIESKIGWTLVGKYEDYGFGKIDDENVGLSRLLEDCEAGKVDLIVAKSFMSFTCNIEYTVTLTKRLRSLEHPVYIKFETENVCSFLPENELFFDILLATEEETTRTRMHKSLLAKGTLQEILQNGPVEYGQIVRAFSKKKVSMCTVKKVRKEMGVISYRQGGKQYWSLSGKPNK